MILKEQLKTRKLVSELVVRVSACFHFYPAAALQIDGETILLIIVSLAVRLDVGLNCFPLNSPICSGLDDRRR